MKFATFQQAFEFNLIADSQSLIEPFCEGNKHGMYQGVYTEESMESLHQRLRALDEENTRLRNNVLTCNDEIYSLRAVAVTVEAELKYNTEVELAKMESELKFRSKELAALSRDHEKALKELAQHKQRAVSVKPIQSELEMDTTDRDYAGGADFDTTYSQSPRSQANATAVKIHAINDGATNVPVTYPTTVPAAVESASVGADTRATGAPFIAVHSSNSTAAISPRAGFSAVQDKPNRIALDAGELRRGRTELLSLIYQRLLTSLVQESVSQGSSLPNAASLLHVLAGFFPITLETDTLTETLPQVVDALVTLSQSLLETARSSFSDAKHPHAISGLQPLLHALALLDCLLRLLLNSTQRIDEHERDVSDIAAVVGNLQNKFELAASTVKRAEAPAADRTGHKTQVEGAQHRWAQAIKTPALTETQRVAVWSTVTCTTKGSKDSTAPAMLLGSGTTGESLRVCVDNCTRFLSQVLMFTGALTESCSERGDHHSFVQLVVRLCCTFCTLAGTAGKSASSSSSGAVTDDDYRAAQTGICRILQSSVPLTVRSETLGMFALFLTSDTCNFRALADAHISPGEQPRISPLMLTVKHLGQPADFPLTAEDTPCAVVLYQCQVAFLLVKLLHRYGGRFVLVLLGLDPSQHLGGSNGGTMRHTVGNGDKPSTSTHAKGTSVSSDSNSTSSGHASHEKKAASTKRALPQEENGGDAVASGGGLPHVTPLHPRKLVKSGRSELQRDSQSNRITPSSHGSGGAGGAPRSHRKLSPGEALDLKDCLHQADRGPLSDVVRAWMGHIRHLDSCSILCRGGAAEAAHIRLVQLLSLFLSETLDLLAPQDCAVLVSDVTEVFHEYIYRCNMGSWHPALRMPDSLFSFLESSRQYESSA